MAAVLLRVLESEAQVEEWAAEGSDWEEEASFLSIIAAPFSRNHQIVLLKDMILPACQLRSIIRRVCSG